MSNSMAAPKRERLSMYTVYDHPSDYPKHFVARRWEIGDAAHATAEIYIAADIERIRNRFRTAGLACLTRQLDDDPVIVEVWL